MVKALKEQVATFQESVDLIEVDTKVKENPVDDKDNDESESLSTRIARLGSTPAKQTKDSTKSLLQDIVFEFNLSEKTDSPMKLHARIDIFLLRKRGGTSYATSKSINLEPTACASLHTGFEIPENAECCNSLVDGNC